MIRIDFGFKVGVQDTAPAAILLASVRAGPAFSEKPESTLANTKVERVVLNKFQALFALLSQIA
jgi:hypothetical protein